MGLDISHDCWSGAYSAFARFRKELHKIAGYGDYNLVYKNDDVRIEGSTIPWNEFTTENYMGEWDTSPNDPLLILLVHSDCDGIIPNEFVFHLATRLQQLLPMLSDEGTGHLSRGYKATAYKFIQGLLLAHEKGEDVEFF